MCFREMLGMHKLWVWYIKVMLKMVEQHLAVDSLKMPWETVHIIYLNNLLRLSLDSVNRTQNIVDGVLKQM